MPQRVLGEGDGDDESPSSFPLIGDQVIISDGEENLHRRPIEPSLWRDEERMKKELMGWAKTVVRMAIAHSPPPVSAAAASSPAAASSSPAAAKQLRQAVRHHGR